MSVYREFLTDIEQMDIEDLIEKCCEFHNLITKDASIEAVAFDKNYVLYYTCKKEIIKRVK